MKTLIFALISCSALIVGAATTQSSQPQSSQPQSSQPQSSQPQEPVRQQDQTKPFMRAKLVGSQNVMDGLVTENFKLIHRGAANMKAISLAVQWPVSQDKVYDHHGEAFRMQCDKLMKLADQENLEGAHFTFLNMTTTCIDCHNHVRGKFRVVQDRTNPQGPMRLIPTEWDEPKFR